jgi:hypothetical protein
MWLMPVHGEEHHRRLLDFSRLSAGTYPAMEEDGLDPMLPPIAGGSDRSRGGNSPHSTHSDFNSSWIHSATHSHT